jgi:peptide/nickel transport system permease protein
MIAYIVRRLIQGFIIVVLVTVLVFLLMRLLPGDPLAVYLSQGELQNMTAADLQALRDRFGLNEPILHLLLWSVCR